MRQHLHLGHVLRKELHMMTDERVELLLRIAGTGGRLPGALQDLSDATLLDYGEQVFLAAHVVVHPGERHTARGGEIPHGGGMVALVREDPGGTGEQMVETLVVWSHWFRTIVRILKLALRSHTRKGLNIPSLPTSTDKRHRWRTLSCEPRRPATPR